MNSHEMNVRMIEVRRDIDAAFDVLDKAVVAKAEASHQLKQAQASAHVQARLTFATQGVKPTVDDLRHAVEAATSEQQREYELAAAAAYSAKRHWEQQMAILSALQTQSGMVREEARLARTAGGLTP